jgi:hypothetical protein
MLSVRDFVNTFGSRDPLPDEKYQGLISGALDGITICGYQTAEHNIAIMKTGERNLTVSTQAGRKIIVATKQERFLIIDSQIYDLRNINEVILNKKISEVLGLTFFYTIAFVAITISIVLNFNNIFVSVIDRFNLRDHLIICLHTDTFIRRIFINNSTVVIIRMT